MKNKTIFLISISCLLMGCAPKNDYTFSNSSFDYGSLENYEIDEDMLVDGKDDEQHYRGLETFDIYEPEAGVTLSTKTYFGNKGLFIYSYVNDTSVYYNRNFDIYCNDGIEMHICVDPASTIKIDNLKKRNQINDSMMQIRSDVSGRMQTWAGNYLSGSYEWTQYHRPCECKVFIDGKLNKENGSNGYGVEYYIPYSTFKLDKAPEEISIMPAFNNTDNNLDTTRKWFTYKGMAHNRPSSWMKISKDGKLVYPGKGCLPDQELTASLDDPKYDGQYLKAASLLEVNSENKNPIERAEFYSFLSEKGIYVRFIVKDKELTRYNDNIWNNDGVEFVIDTVRDGTDNTYKDGVFRFGFDVDNGVETDICLTGFSSDYASYRIQTSSKVSIEEIEEEQPYGYKYRYVYEIFIPYEAMNVTYKKDMMLYIAYAVKTPNEATYILNRTDGNTGLLDPSDFLFIDARYVKLANQFFWVTEGGLK